MKQCRTCHEEKPRAMYSKKPDSKDGLQHVCKSCAAAYRKAWVATKPGYVPAYNQRYLVENQEKIAAQKRTKRLADPAAYAASAQKRYARNAVSNRAKRREYYKANRERCLAVVREWRQSSWVSWYKAHAKKNSARFAAVAAKRRAQERQATPEWADGAAIEAFYITAAGLSMHTGEWYHVDHIVPIRGKTVCGLHVESNLEVLTAQENLLKSNRYWPDQPQ